MSKILFSSSQGLSDSYSNIPLSRAQSHLWGSKRRANPPSTLWTETHTTGTYLLLGVLVYLAPACGSSSCLALLRAVNSKGLFPLPHLLLFPSPIFFIPSRCISPSLSIAACIFRVSDALISLQAVLADILPSAILVQPNAPYGTSHAMAEKVKRREQKLATSEAMWHIISR